MCVSKSTDNIKAMNLLTSLSYCVLSGEIIYLKILDSRYFGQVIFIFKNTLVRMVVSHKLYICMNLLHTNYCNYRYI